MGGSPGEARLRRAVVGLLVVLFCCVALGIARARRRRPAPADLADRAGHPLRPRSGARGRALRRLLAVRRPAARARPRRSNGRGPPWSGRFAATRPSPSSLPGTAARSATCARAAAGRSSCSTTTCRSTSPCVEPCRRSNAPCRRRIHPPVEAIQSGYASVSRSAAIRIAEGDRARRADRRAAAPDRPPARLPLAGGGGDPACLRCAHGLRRARSPRPARLRDDDRSPLGGRLHDDGPRPRGRLLAVHRLPLSRGAGERAPRRGRRHGSRGARRAGRRCSPARRSSPRSSSRRSCSRARCSSRWRRRSSSSPRSASRSPGSRCRPCWRCSASGSTSGAIGRRAPGGPGAPGSRPPPTPPCAAPPWRRR